MVRARRRGQGQFRGGDAGQREGAGEQDVDTREGEGLQGRAGVHGESSGIVRGYLNFVLYS